MPFFYALGAKRLANKSFTDTKPMEQGFYIASLKNSLLPDNILRRNVTCLEYPFRKVDTLYLSLSLADQA